MRDGTHLPGSYSTTVSIFSDVYRLLPSDPDTKFSIESPEFSSTPKKSVSGKSPAQEETSILKTPSPKKRLKK